MIELARASGTQVLQYELFEPTGVYITPQWLHALSVYPAMSSPRLRIRDADLAQGLQYA
ncbi:hypothetical protein ACIPJG_25300 [Streptomyces halstedii]|uniref:hypothetical protein n=1 Tax=Streptomyces halstedii TaxID=1944 RepID=UPI0037F8718F